VPRHCTYLCILHIQLNELTSELSPTEEIKEKEEEKKKLGFHKLTGLFRPASRKVRMRAVQCSAEGKSDHIQLFDSL
jgi:hypothetical protein